MGQNYRFLFYAKNHQDIKERSCSMKIFCKFLTVNISKLFRLVICIAQNLIWTTLKAIFSILNFFAPSDSRFSNSCISAKYCLILTNHTSVESLFIQLTRRTVVQGHIYILILQLQITYIQSFLLFFFLRISLNISQVRSPTNSLPDCWLGLLTYEINLNVILEPFIIAIHSFFIFHFSFWEFEIFICKAHKYKNNRIFNLPFAYFSFDMNISDFTGVFILLNHKFLMY